MGIASYFYQAYHQMIKENIRKAREVSDMTRFEKLKEMSIEEVAEWLVDHIECEMCPVPVHELCKSYKDCGEHLIGFLNEEVPDENAVCSSCAINFGDGERTENGKID